MTHRLVSCVSMVKSSSLDMKTIYSASRSRFSRLEEITQMNVVLPQDDLLVNRVVFVRFDALLTAVKPRHGILS